jgi:3-methyladenine DNA glycosylase AlkD
VEIVGTIWHELAQVGDPDRAAAQQAYMKSELPYRGISKGELTALMRPILRAWRPDSREEWEAAIRQLWDEVTYREEWYAGLALLRHRPAEQWLDRDAVGLLRHVITAGAWWDVVDETATHPLRTALTEDRDALTPVVRGWANDEDLWLRRSSVICQIGAKDETDLRLLTHAIEANLDDRSFWLRKAIGWALRHYARTDPDWVIEHVEMWGSRLSGLSRREALKHL